MKITFRLFIIFAVIFAAVLFQEMSFGIAPQSSSSLAPKTGFGEGKDRSFYQEFEGLYAKEIKQEVEKKACYNELARHHGLNINEVRQVVYEREMAFCGHVLEQLTVILEMAGNKLAKGKQPNISILFDVDETIGGQFPDWDIRPSIPFLFKFLKDKFNAKIGIASMRSKGALLDQLEESGPFISYSLTEIKDFIDDSMVFSVRETYEDMVLANPLTDPLYGEFNSIFPGFEVLDPEAILHSMGWGRLKIGLFESVHGPCIFKAWERYRLKRDGLPVSKLKELSEQSYRKRVLLAVDQIKLLLDCARDIKREFIDGDGEKYAEDFFAELSKVGISRDDIIGFSKVRIEYNRRLGQIARKNREAVKSCIEMLRKIFLRETGKYAPNPQSPLFRISAAKHLLDKGQADIALAIDNDTAAGVFFRLFTGKIKDANGRDGYSILGLDKYRGRLFLCHTGARGEYCKLGILKECTAKATVHGDVLTGECSISTEESV